MKVIKESKLGVEYIADVISSCDQNGVECIVDDKAGDILYYDPKGAKFGNDKLLQNSDVSIFDALKDKELFASTMKTAEGDEFKQFAVQWNDLQKKGDEDEVFKTNHCNPIRGNFAEAQVSESSYPMWHERYTTARNHLAQACQYMQQAVYEDRDNPKFKAIYEKMYALLGKVDSQWDKNVKRGKKEGWLAKESVCEGLGDDPRDWSANEDDVEIEWLIDDRDFSIHKGDTQYVVIDLDLVDSFEELVQQVSDALYKECGEYPMEYGEDWGFVDEDALMKRFGYSVDESEDDPRDWSASEGEVEIIWDTDEYEDFGIFSGDTSHYVIDYDRVDTHDDLINEVCRLIGKEYPDLDFDPSDFVIANEDEFWEQRGGNPGLLDDTDLDD